MQANKWFHFSSNGIFTNSIIVHHLIYSLIYFMAPSYESTTIKIIKLKIFVMITITIMIII